MSSQIDPNAERNDAQSALLRSILTEASPDDTDTAGQRLRLSTFVAEVTEITPSKLADALAARVQQTLTKTIDRLGQVYINKVRERVPDEQEVLNIRDTAEGKFYEFALTLRELLTRAIVDIENFMTENSFNVDLDLYTGGFLRFRHNEGIDYTDPAAASALEKQVSDAEEELEALMKERAILRLRETHLKNIVIQAEQLDSWLGRALAGGQLRDKANQVYELAAVVAEGMEALHQALNQSA